MGWPSVFQTAPPPPASKARMIWPPELAGGAEASQNGLGETMPAVLLVRSGMVASRQVRMNGVGRALSLRDGVDDFLAAVGAIAPGKPSLAAGTAVLVDDDAAVVDGDPLDAGDEIAELALADREKHPIGGD